MVLFYFAFLSICAISEGNIFIFKTMLKDLSNHCHETDQLRTESLSVYNIHTHANHYKFYTCKGSETKLTLGTLHGFVPIFIS